MAKKSSNKQNERLIEEKLVPGKPGSGELFDVSYGDESKPVECLGMTFPNDEARRAHFTERLREKLKDPEFRKIEGFPTGDDEDILAISDPPYYTACPNPWLSQFVELFGQSYDANKSNQKEPFAADVSEGKSHPLYNAHSYHTKVPHRAVMRYILHYTNPGDLVFDGFCGTGMTGVAAQLCGDRKEVESLGYGVGDDGTIFNDSGVPFSSLGKRRVILSDLSPIATFIAHNYNTPINVELLTEEARAIYSDVHKECGWMYATRHLDGTFGSINCTVWSELFACPDCGKEVVYWDAAVDNLSGEVHEKFHCNHCSAIMSKRDASKVKKTYFDSLLKRPVTVTKLTPVLISYTVHGKRETKKPDIEDIKLIERIESSLIPYHVPVDRMMHAPDDVEKWGDRWRAGSASFTHVHHLFTKRNLWILGAFEHRIRHSRSRFLLTGIINRSTHMNRIHLKNFFFGGGGWNAGYMKGAIYTSSLPIETSIFEQWEDRLNSITKAFNGLATHVDGCILSTQSTTDIKLLESSVDYVFLDPPFGSNLNYSELNFLWESWLRVWTNLMSEAIQSDFQKKDLGEYRSLMLLCFKNAYRVLKPGRWMTVEFSNTNASVWNSIQTALNEAGFVVSNVTALDKRQGTFNAITNNTSVKQDLVISAYKPNGGFEDRFAKSAHTEDGVWDFVRTHLSYLPVAPCRGNFIQAVPERDARILFDQVVSYYVKNGYPIPLSSREFQAGLDNRFPEREGMYFLSEQVSVYDAMRLQADFVQQQELFVNDEKSAIQWLRRCLARQPMKYQELSPQYMKEAQRIWDKHEQPVELRAILEQNFFQDEDGIWRVPDPRNEAHLEQIRHRALMNEFQQYLDSKGKLKIVRTEALRAGFKESWQKKDYTTIVQMAKRVPDAVIQEDPALLMYFDNASLLKGE